MLACTQEGNEIELTFGGDSFGVEARGSEYQAISTLLEKLGEYPNARLFLYRERPRTFHPKIYLFANEKHQRALLILGSSNWSAGGFHDNIEANVIVKLDLSQADQQACYNELREHFTTYWQEQAKADA